MPQGLFITGTDTEVGKTWVGSQLARALYQQGFPLVVRKPAESGCETHSGELQPADAITYWHAVDQSQALADICPFRYKAALAPVQAARLQQLGIYTQDLLAACQVHSDQFLMVEGAGGFYSPMTEDGLNADLAKALNLPVLLVAEDKLGCLNHVLLTHKAIVDSGLPLTAVILNRTINEFDTTLSNADMLKEQLSEPVIETADKSWLKQLTHCITQ